MRYISILRGINVGGNRKVPMAELKSACQEAGFREVQTYIQSGNVIFTAADQPTTVLEEQFQKLIAGRFGFNDVPVIVRTAGEWAQSVANNPFWNQPDADIGRLHLTFLKAIPDPELVAKIKSLYFAPDRFEIVGKDAFIFCSAGYSDSKLTNSFFESKLNVQATTRNWKTVMKLYEMTL